MWRRAGHLSRRTAEGLRPFKSEARLSLADTSLPVFDSTEGALKFGFLHVEVGHQESPFVGDILDSFADRCPGTMTGFGLDAD